MLENCKFIKKISKLLVFIMKEKISIIMPIYNSERYLIKSIESIINQSYKNWELICVDDCSSDKLKSY